MTSGALQQARQQRKRVLKFYHKKLFKSILILENYLVKMSKRGRIFYIINSNENIILLKILNTSDLSKNSFDKAMMMQYSNILFHILAVRVSYLYCVYNMYVKCLCVKTRIKQP